VECPLNRIGASHRPDSYLRDGVDALFPRCESVPDEEIVRILKKNTVPEKIS
jgi:hypothetical protein